MLVALRVHDGAQVARHELQAHALQLLRVVLFAQRQGSRHCLDLQFTSDTSCQYKQLICSLLHVSCLHLQRDWLHRGLQLLGTVRKHAYGNRTSPFREGENSLTYQNTPLSSAQHPACRRAVIQAIMLIVKLHSYDSGTLPDMLRGEPRTPSAWQKVPRT